MYRRPFRSAVTSIGTVVVLILHAASAALAQDVDRQEESAIEEACFTAPSYIVYRRPGPIEADGVIDEPAWEAAPRTSPFVEMTGRAGTSPRSSSRAIMLWDDEALYVAAELEEPHVWATATERDTRIYLDNAFEIFIDPDGDTQQYYELEVNALGTIWDLMLPRPYRDGGFAISAWDVRELGVGVHVDGTLNDPSDTDGGWTVEFALPWSAIAEAAPDARLPRAGEQWRLNLSRSHWTLDVTDGAYRKRPDTPANWSSWSPQGEVDIHKPECWGFVEFSDVVAGEDSVKFAQRPDEPVKWALRRLYYRQRAYREAHGRYADELDALEPGDIDSGDLPFEPLLRTTQSAYEITSPGTNGATVHIRHDGRIWSTQE